MNFDMASSLDVAVGVAFLLLILSMIVSYVNEIFAKIFSWRAKTLKEGIANLLSDPGSNAFVELFYSHPLIQTLGRSHQGKTVDNPSYIPSATFAKALSETLRRTATERARSQGATRGNKILQRGDSRTSAHIIQSNSALTRMPQSTDNGISIDTINDVIEDVGAMVSHLPDGDLKTALMIFAKRAEGNLAVFEQSVVEWFDNAMDRVSGWYKRLVQRSMFCLALTITIVLNADVLAFSNALWKDPQLSQYVVSIASEYHDEQVEDGSSQPSPEAINQEYLDLSSTVGIPLGWEKQDIVLESILISIPGWLLTAILASFGAPFWFNALTRLLDIRGSGTRPRASNQTLLSFKSKPNFTPTELGENHV